MKLGSIYELFKDYTKEEVDNIINYLSSEEKELIKKRYGDDLSNPKNNKDFSKEDRVEFYGCLKPKMITMLAKQRNGKLEEYLNRSNEIKSRKERLIEKKVSVPSIEKQNKDEEVVLKLGKAPSKEKTVTKYEIQITGIIEMDGRSFKTDTTSCFLKLSPEEVNRITINALKTYKNHLMELLDSTVENTEEKGKQLVLKSNNNK